MDSARISFKVFGTVQGIGYRWFVQETARKHSIAGWVRNVPDGSVEGEAQAGRKALENFLQDLKMRHPWARVSSIDVRELEAIREDRDFLIRLTP
ncbi:MAG: acylphosphatase [Elusimicrobia bacterium]|nr:acylphosphatase [Elusimicrobiota bacterium]